MAAVTGRTAAGGRAAAAVCPVIFLDTYRFEEGPAMTRTIHSFADAPLAAGLHVALTENGILTPFPIQAATLPDSLAGRDVLGRGRTGSGKTLAFGLPLLSRTAGRRARPGRPSGSSWSRPANSPSR
ncbi:hypothetical protein GCM10027615_24410 [Plantactinospora veratri]